MNNIINNFKKYISNQNINNESKELTLSDKINMLCQLETNKKQLLSKINLMCSNNINTNTLYRNLEIFTDNFGVLNLETKAHHNNYETNKYKTFLTNDVIWTPPSYITKGGFVNSLQGMIRNTNYETKKTGEYKDGATVNEIHGVLGHKVSLP